MDPIKPWVDPIEVRRLADCLMRPAREPGVTVTDAGFDQAFVGYATTGSASPAPPPTQMPAPHAPESQPEPPRPKALEPLPSSARGPFLERIQRFRDWMRHQFTATGIFILDREGLVIFDESNHGRLHFMARSLALASRRQGSPLGNVHVKIGAEATLEVIPVETAYGCLVLGAVVPDALPPAAITAVMNALSQVAAPPDAP